MPSAGRKKMHRLWMMKIWWDKGWRQRSAQGWRQAALHPPGCAAPAGRRKASSACVLQHPEGNWLQSKTIEPELAWHGCAKELAMSVGCRCTAPQADQGARPGPRLSAKSFAGFLRSAMDHHVDRELWKYPSHPPGFAHLKPAENSGCSQLLQFLTGNLNFYTRVTKEWKNGLCEW